MTTDPTRREFVLALLAALAGVSLPAACAAPDPAAVRSAIFGERALEKERIADYTRLYLAGHPEEAGVAALRRKLFGRRWSGDGERLKRKLRDDVRGDFEEGRVVNLDGWLLSRTEVRLWCLYVAVSA